jgi:hypothetical protein
MRRAVLLVGRALVIQHGEAAGHMRLEGGIARSGNASCH